MNLFRLFAVTALLTHMATAAFTAPSPTIPANPQLEPLELGLKVLNGFLPKKCDQQPEGCLTVLNTFGQTLFNLQILNLTAKEKARVGDFRNRIIKTQRVALPLIRKGYTKIIGQRLWEYDVYAKSKGAGNRTLALTGGMFASNGNIKQVHESLHALLVKLRFNKVTYHIIEETDGIYISVKQPYTDDTILAWNEDNIVVVK